MAKTERPRPHPPRPGSFCVPTPYRGRMTTPTAFRDVWLTLGTDESDLTITVGSGVVLKGTLPDLVLRAKYAQLSDSARGEEAAPEILRFSWLESAACDDNDDCELGTCEHATMGPILRAARILVEEVPMKIPVRRQVAEGTWETVEISPEEWARNEGRRTRG